MTVKDVVVSAQFYQQLVLTASHHGVFVDSFAKLKFLLGGLSNFTIRSNLL